MRILTLFLLTIIRTKDITGTKIKNAVNSTPDVPSTNRAYNTAVTTHILYDTTILKELATVDNFF